MEEDERFFWDEYGDLVASRVLRALYLSCGDSATCYEAHAGKSLYELAEEFAGKPGYDITERDLELLREMPRDIYEKCDTEVREEIKVQISWLNFVKYVSEHPEELATTFTHSAVLLGVAGALDLLAKIISSSTGSRAGCEL
jgi:uncharacterized protein YfeS